MVTAQDFSTPTTSLRDVIHGNWNRKNFGVAFGLCAGFIAPIVGSIVTVISWFKDPAWHGVSLHQVGTILFVLTLPFLLLGAHCLDLIDNEKKAAHAVEGEKRDNNDLARD